MYTPDWDYSEPEPIPVLVTCDWCGTTYEWGILGNHPQSECLEVQAENEAGND